MYETEHVNRIFVYECTIKWCESENEAKIELSVKTKWKVMECVFMCTFLFELYIENGFATLYG